MSETKLRTGLVRLSFVQLWEPKADKKGDKFYSCCVMVPKSDKATVKAIKEATEAAKSAKWGTKAPKGLKLPLRDGDEEKDGPEFEGMYFFNCKTKSKPGIIDAKREEILDEGEVYSGVWGKVLVDLYPFEGDEAKGIAVGLKAFQKLKDDAPLSGGGWSADDFEDEEEDDEI